MHEKRTTTYRRTTIVGRPHGLSQMSHRLRTIFKKKKKIQVGNDQEKAQSESNSQSENRGGKTKLIGNSAESL